MLLVIRVETIFTHSSTLISVWQRFTSFDTWKSLISRVKIYEVVHFMLVVSFWGRKCHVSYASSQGRTGVRIFVILAIRFGFTILNHVADILQQCFVLFITWHSLTLLSKIICYNVLIMLTYMFKRIIIFTLHFHKKLDTHPTLFTKKKSVNLYPVFIP